MKTTYVIGLSLCLLIMAGCKKQNTCNSPSSTYYSGFNSTLTVTTSDSYVTTRVEYGPAGFTKGQGTVVSLGHTGGSVSGLTPGTVYDAFIQGVCEDGGSSNWSSRISTTVVSYGNCNAPTNPGDVSSTSGDYVYLRWEYGYNSSANTFEIQYGPSGFITGQGTSEQVTLTTFNTGTFSTGTYVVGQSYDFMVRAKCPDGSWSAWSERHTFTAISTNAQQPVCAAPTNVLSSVSGSYVDLSWDQNGQSQWDVGLSTGSNTVPTNVTTQYGNTATYYNIYTNTDYYFYVRSVCSGSARSAWTVKHFRR